LGTTLEANSGTVKIALGQFHLSADLGLRWESAAATPLLIHRRITKLAWCFASRRTAPRGLRPPFTPGRGDEIV
jgi:hypothetical protein